MTPWCWLQQSLKIPVKLVGFLWIIQLVTYDMAHVTLCSGLSNRETYFRKRGFPCHAVQTGKQINILRYFKYSWFSGISIIVMLFLETLGPFFSTIRFTFERQEGRPEGSDLRQGFLPLKIVQPLRLKARSSSLYPSAMCLLNVWTRINKLFLFFGPGIEVMHFDSRKNNMSALNNERFAKIWNHPAA